MPLKRRIWAAFERIIPRGVLAVTIITAAAVTDPHAVGLYSWAVLALTFYQSLTDQPIRHIAVAHVATSDGEHFLRRYALLAGSSGVVFMTAAAWVIASFSEGRSAPTRFLDLAPLILVPPAQSMAVRATARLQRSGLWGEVSLWRTIGSLAGVAIGVPAVLISRSVVGASTAVVTSEVLYAVLVCASSRGRRRTVGTSAVPGDIFVGTWATYGHMVVYSVLGWLQGQSERVLLGAWAGTSALGSYSLGSSIGRSAGDALAASQANVLRVELSRSDSGADHEIQKTLARNLRAGVLLAGASAVAAIGLSTSVLSPFLGPDWHAALRMVPILALTAIPMAVAASSAPVHVQRGNARIAFLAPAICLVFAPLVAVAAMSSLTMAAWTVLLRECALATIQSLLMGRATPWREVIFAAAGVAIGSIAVVTLDSVLGP